MQFGFTFFPGADENLTISLLQEIKKFKVKKISFKRVKSPKSSLVEHQDLQGQLHISDFLPT